MRGRDQQNIGGARLLFNPGLFHKRGFFCSRGFLLLLCFSGEARIPLPLKNMQRGVKHCRHWKAVCGNSSSSEDRRSQASSSSENGGALFTLGDDYYIRVAGRPVAAEEFSKCPPGNLKAVSHLVVGHVKFGEVEWLDPVDLSAGMNFADLVCISNYGVQALAPACGLHGRVLVRMFHVFPLDAASEQPAKNPEAMERFASKLELLVTTHLQAAGGAHLGLTPDGTWVFRCVL